MSRQPFPQKSQSRPEFRIDILVGVLAVAAIGYSVGRYFVDRSNYTKGHEAYRKIDCSVATEHFDRLLNQWRIIDVGGYAALAQQEKSECLDFKPAFEQEQTGKVGQAIVAYKDFLNKHNIDSHLVNAARERVKSIFEKNKPAKLATPELCENLSQLKTDLISQADTNLPPLYIACAENYTSLKAYDKASQTYESFLDKYPNHSLVSEAKAGWARTLVAQAKEQGAGTLNPPERSNNLDGGPPVVTIQNESPEPMRIVFSGPEGRIEELEKCSSCEKYVGKGPESCPNKGPVGRYTLKPGEYDVVVKSIGDRLVKPFKGTWSMNSGSNYSNCFYIVTNPTQKQSDSQP